MKAIYLVPGDIAGTRPRAARLRHDINRRLDELPARGHLEIDLSGVTVMSGAFGDELIGKLATERPADPRIVLVADDETVRQRVTLVLTRRGTAAWMRRTTEPRPVLVGAGSNAVAAG